MTNHLILVIHHHVEQMQYAKNKMVPALVLAYRNISVIRIRVVAQNVPLTMIVAAIKLA